MFLLLGAGFLAGAASLFSEIVGGCFKCCKRSKRADRRDSIDSNPRWHNKLTPREKINSIQDSNYLENYLINVRSKSVGSVQCEVHKESDTSQAEKDDSSDYEEEIDRLFDLGNLFGEVNDVEEREAQHEQITEHNEKLVLDRNQ